MALTRVEERMPPPERPLDIPTASQKENVSRRLGLSLPTDYWLFFEKYGSGQISYNFQGDEPVAIDIYLYNPSSQHYFDCVESDCGMIRQLSENDSSGQYAIYPDFPGLLPWGRDVDGGVFCWWTRGSPETWPVIYLPEDAKLNESKRFDLTFTGFIDNLIHRNVSLPGWEEAEYFAHPDAIEYTV